MNIFDLTLLWQILGYGGLAALAIVLIFAIIEPGPLQKPKSFGGSKKDPAPETELETKRDSDPLAKPDHSGAEESPKEARGERSK